MCPQRAELPSRAHQVGKLTCHFCRSFANRLWQGLVSVKVCRATSPTTRATFEHIEHAELRAMPKRRRNDRKCHVTASSSFLLPSSSYYRCMRAPRPTRCTYLHSMPEAVEAPLLSHAAQGLSMLRAASQALKPREFLWKMHCPLLPKFWVRAAVQCAVLPTCILHRKRTQMHGKSHRLASHAHSVKRASRAQVLV